MPIDFHADEIPDRHLEGFCTTEDCRDQLVLVSGGSKATLHHSV